MFLAQNAFNYSHLGVDGFCVGTNLIEHTECYDFQYSQLDKAIAVFNDLADRGPNSHA